MKLGVQEEEEQQRQQTLEQERQKIMKAVRSKDAVSDIQDAAAALAGTDNTSFAGLQISRRCG